MVSITTFIFGVTMIRMMIYALIAAIMNLILLGVVLHLIDGQNMQSGYKAASNVILSNQLY